MTLGIREAGPRIALTGRPSWLPGRRGTSCRAGPGATPGQGSPVSTGPGSWSWTRPAARAAWPWCWTAATSFGRTILYVPHGPLWDREAADAAEVLAHLVTGLKAHARERRGIVLKLDPRASGRRR